MKLGRLNDNHTCERRKEMKDLLAIVSFALIPIALIMTIAGTSPVHNPYAILDVYVQFNINSVEAASTVADAATPKNTAANATIAAPQNPAIIRSYVNPVFGISVEYPSTWSAFELNSRFRDNVTYGVALLRAPLENASDKYAEGVRFGMQIFKVNNVTLNDYTSSILNSYRNATGIKILDSSPTTLSGQPAYRIVYTDDRVEGIKLKKMQVWSVLNNSKAYVLTFGSEESKYADYLPQVQHIMSSFKIIGGSDNPQVQRDLVFDDPTFGVKLQYPSSWTKIQLGQPPRSNVDLVGAFIHRENQNATLSRIGVAVQPLRSQDVKLDQYTPNQLNAIKRVNATVLEDKETNIAGNPAHNAVFTINETKVMQIWALKGDKAYIFAYQASPNEYAKNLPTFQRIIDSLEIK
jgi:hypothetical protein